MASPEPPPLPAPEAGSSDAETVDGGPVNAAVDAEARPSDAALTDGEAGPADARVE
jgi:hypothetical protein